MSRRAPCPPPERAPGRGATASRAATGTRRWRLLTAAAALALAAAPGARGAVLPPDPERTIGARIDFDGFVDDHGRPFVAGDDGRPWLVVPMYTRCQTTCGALVDGVRGALRAAGVTEDEARVVLFSFDPEESGDALAALRARMALPPAWHLLRAAGRDHLRRLQRQLDFRTRVLAGDHWAHPNVAAVLAPDRRLVAWLYGVRPPPDALARAVRRARGGASALDRWRPYLFVLAALGVLGSGASCVAILRRRQAVHPPPAGPPRR